MVFFSGVSRCSSSKTNCKGAISSDHTEAAKASYLSVSYLLRNVFSFCVECFIVLLWIWGVSRCLFLFVVERHCCILTRLRFYSLFMLFDSCVVLIDFRFSLFEVLFVVLFLDTYGDYIFAIWGTCARVWLSFISYVSDYS